MGTHSPQNLVNLLQGMVRIDSVNSTLTGRAGAEAVLCDWLEGVAKRWRLKTKRLPVSGRSDQLLVTYEVAADRPWLLFDSHMDTVSADGMTVEPFGGELRDGRVYGRGACDTKGTGAAMLWALKHYAEQAEGNYNIAVLFSIDEEVGMWGIRSFLKTDFKAAGFEPGNVLGVIVGEPTELHPVIAHGGLVRWKVTTHGVAAHSSVPHEGRSAISAMVKLIQAIESDYIANLSAEHELTGHAACSINMIQGGSATNIIPDICQIDVDRRVAPGEDFDSVTPALINVLESVKAQDPDVDCTVEILTTHPPLLPDNNMHLLDVVKGVLSDHGLPQLHLGAPFATHGSYFGQAGLPTVVLGPGEIHKAHTKDEYISIEQLERGAQVYLGLMRADFT